MPVGSAVNPATDYALTFYYPTAAAPTTTMTVTAPDMGDPETVDLRLVIEQTAAAELIVFTRGPTVYFLEFEFSNVNRLERDAFQAFFRDTVVGSKNTFQLRRPKYHNLDENEVPLGAFLYAGCQFDQGDLTWRETHRRGYGYSASVRIRSTGRTDVA